MNLESLEGILDDCLACGKTYPGLANYNNGLTTKNTYISADPGRQQGGARYGTRIPHLNYNATATVAKVATTTTTTKTTTTKTTRRTRTRTTRTIFARTTFARTTFARRICPRLHAIFLIPCLHC